MALVDELRQDVGGAGVRPRLALDGVELGPQLLGLELELLGQGFLHCSGYLLLDDVLGPSTTLRAHLQQVGRDTLMSYRSELGDAGELGARPRLSAFKVLT